MPPKKKKSGKKKRLKVPSSVRQTQGSRSVGRERRTPTTGIKHNYKRERPKTLTSIKLNVEKERALKILKRMVDGTFPRRSSNVQ